MYFKFFKREIIYCILTYIALMGLSWITIDRIIVKHSEMILLSSIMLVISRYFYKERKKYYIFLGISILLGMSPIIIKLLINENMYLDTINRYFGFFVACINLVLIIIHRINILKLRIVVNSIFLLILFFPIICLWAYYISSGTWLNVDAILAIMQTNFREAIGYIQGHFYIINVIELIVLIICILILSYYSSNIKNNKNNKILVLLFLCMNVFIIYKCQYNIITNIYFDTKVYIDKYKEFYTNKQIRKERIDTSFNIDNKEDKGVYVLVIGESQNKNHFSRYGYERKTTPWLDSINNKNMLIFSHAYSCYVQTVPALTYALTAKNQYNTLNLPESVSILEVVKKAGFDTVWLSNQVQYGAFDTPIRIIADEANQQKWINNTVGEKVDINFYDEKLVNCIDDIKISDKMFIVIHLMGSHAPYEDRYPSNFATFGNFNKLDRYDNSILYTDYVMSLIFEKVKSIPNFKGLIYFSDHGEGVDKGLEHDPNNFVYEMVNIPMYIFLSNNYIQEHPIKYNNLQKAKDYPFTNDLIFNTVLGIMDINIKNIYEPENDITSNTYNYNYDRFTTMYNKVKILNQ